MANVTRALSVAVERQQIGRQFAPAAAAIGLHALIDGLIQNWILDPAAFDLVRVGEQVLDAYLRGLAAAPVLVEADAASKVSRQCSRTP